MGRAIVLLAAAVLVLSAGAASGASLSSSRAKGAVVSYVKKKWGSDYAVHPACYKTSARKSRCFVHMIHETKSCTRYATVTLKGRRVVVRMSRPGC
jgi:hypothetical protein